MTEEKQVVYNFLYNIFYHTLKSKCSNPLKFIPKNKIKSNATMQYTVIINTKQTKQINIPPSPSSDKEVLE